MVSGLLHAGVIVQVPEDQGFYSNLFVVPKKDGSFCPVLDLKGLNKFIRYHRFRMETILSVIRSLSKGDFLDIQDASLHVPIWPGQITNFYSLPFSSDTTNLWPFQPFLSPEGIHQDHDGGPASSWHIHHAILRQHSS